MKAAGIPYGDSFHAVGNMQGPATRTAHGRGRRPCTSSTRTSTSSRSATTTTGAAYFTTIGFSGEPLAPTIGIGAATKKPFRHAVGRAVGGERVEVEQLAHEQAEVAQRGHVPREELVARLGRHDRARGGVGRDHRDVVIVQPRDRARSRCRARARSAASGEPAASADFQPTWPVCTSTMSPAPTRTPCAAAAPSSSSGPIGKPALEVLDAGVARDVEQHRAPDDAVREVVHAEPARAAGRGHEPGPVAVVERRRRRRRARTRRAGSTPAAP